MKLGLVARMDMGHGLANQTHNLARLLEPDRILLVDSTPFNGAAQHPEAYARWDYTVTSGFPNGDDVRKFLDGLTHVITCETPYHYYLFTLAKQMHIKTYLQYNYEFLDYLIDPRKPQPTYFLAPSRWHLDVMRRRYPNRVTFLPPPLFTDDFVKVREANARRPLGGRRRFLHVVGKAAVHDRNGTLSLLEAVKRSKSDFELVIKAQEPLEVDAGDKRIRFDYSNPANNAELYEGFDALIMPRRYGGLCLPMNEALMCGLPVIMTDVSPNNDILPRDWLVEANKVGSFITRTKIDLYAADPDALAAKLDEFACVNADVIGHYRADAFDIGYRTFSAEVLKGKYEQALAV